jgi:hypothetical protein
VKKVFMNAETFAEWLRRQGHHVVRTASSYWYDAGPRVYQAFPYHWLIQPSAREMRELLIGKGAAAIRYSAPFDASNGKVSYHVILEGSTLYNLETLRAQARNGVRRGLSICQVERIPLERLAEEGWLLQQDTLDRQGRSRSMSQADWQRICLAAKDLAGFEAWGAIVAGELAASVLTVRIDDVYCVPYAQSLSKFLNKYVNNALFYTYSRELLSRPGVNTVFYGLHSLDAPESVDEFKFRMSLTPKPVRQCVVFTPLLMPVCNSAGHAVVKRLLHRYPDSPTLAKSEGMLRFSLQGERPADRQDWPECLADRKQELLQSLNLPGPDPNKPGAARQESRSLTINRALGSDDPSGTLVSR